MGPRSTRLPLAPLDTAYWGIELRCVEAECVWPGEFELSSLTVYAAEAQGPSISPVADPASLWDHAGGGEWVWNAPGDPWPLPVSGTDSSGVCSLSVQAGAGQPIADPSLTGPNDSSWQECSQPASWTGAVDTREYVSGSGQLPVSLEATNAAALPSATLSETLNVDNDPVSVSLGTPDDLEPDRVGQPRGNGRRHAQHRPVRSRRDELQRRQWRGAELSGGRVSSQRRRGENGFLHRLEQRGRPAGQP